MHATWHHLALAVKNIEQTKNFYCQLLGFEVDWEKKEVTGDKFSKIVSLQGATADIVMLKGFGSRLELFHYHEPQGTSMQTKRQCDFGYTHFALSVSNIWEWYDTLSDQKAYFHCPPQNLRPGVWVTYLDDPEGNTIELVEYEAS
jgi:catechol 2,3-dioxygenase-like lactoylglutathione lyase family enzyme